MTHDCRIKAVIFDLGRVLVDFDHTIAARRMAAYTAKDPGEIFAMFFDSELTGSFEEGKIAPREFFERVMELLRCNLTYEQFLPIWNEIFFLTDTNRAVYALASGLKQRFKVALVSNINRLHFEYLKDHFPIFDCFHCIVASYEVGVRKPDPKIYEQALKSLGVLPQETFYTDDRQELIAGASRLGIRSFVFRDIARLKKDMRANGIALP
ncbi:MAG TPA: HAD family phosphatase [Patescibacteria group bacterium]|nr:HAD family phosphatase [Patescibacteria group bacterium]